ncbi:conserved hypothetical protein [Xenorhabdus nematophila ATCC 19061]|uniref:Uncharacterized protein n=1 Tax=Xenorhabdus nematophila (strain ATCC 19061 / DSM 3370 / CCUG 14189 / LMG 1036 / NCIMB 9965 / AN6) TaxID=406817 RepID=D3VDP0_XENNA|nr:conserved hypothetical protein [Xenorhabdus nematophila ATCC 19061]
MFPVSTGINRPIVIPATASLSVPRKYGDKPGGRRSRSTGMACSP